MSSIVQQLRLPQQLLNLPGRVSTQRRVLLPKANCLRQEHPPQGQCLLGILPQKVQNLQSNKNRLLRVCTSIQDGRRRVFATKLDTQLDQQSESSAKFHQEEGGQDNVPGCG